MTYRQRKALMGVDAVSLSKHKERASTAYQERKAKLAKDAARLDSMRWHEIAKRFPHADRATSRPLHGVELGTYRGHNAEKLLQMMPTLQLTVIDAWGGVPLDDGSAYVSFSDSNWQAVHDECMTRLASFADRVKVLRQATTDTSAITDQYDFVFVDADHSYDGCCNDIAAWWPMVKSGGYLCGHDYGDKPAGKEQYNKPGVTRAVNEFSGRLGLDLVTGSDGTWFVQKPAETGAKVVSFWFDTPESGTYYKDSAAALKASLAHLGIAHTIKHPKTIKGIAGLTGRDKWLAVARHKVDVIATELRKGKPFWWCDVDYVFDRTPVAPSGYPVAAVAYRAEKAMRYVPLWHSGLIYFDGSKQAQEIVAQWKDELATQPDDHIALDAVLMRNESLVATLAHEYCWRGEQTAMPIYGRLRKRVRETSATSDAHLLTVAFGESIKPLLDAHIASIRCNVPNARHVMVSPPEPQDDNPCALPKWASPNHYKLKFWADYVSEHQGTDVILLDADTIILHDPRIRFDQSPAFDLCFTDRVDRKHPINGGVIFVRCNERTAAFFDEWLRYDDRVFNDREYFQQAQRVAMGQNQASLGMMLADNVTHECKIEFVPCSTWNSVNSTWKDFGPATCYILHVKNGGLREYVTTSEIGRLSSTTAPRAVINTWNLWAPCGYLRSTLEGLR